MSKPYKSIDEQIALLRKRGVDTDARTYDILLREGYYSVVNGYKDLFVVSTFPQDAYRKGTEFREIYRLFLFDRRLRHILFRYLASAEATLKTTVAYHFAEMFQDNHEAYLDKNSYRKEQDYEYYITKLIDDLLCIIDKHPTRQPQHHKPYIEHYLTNHGEVPIWVLTNYFTLGQTFKFYDFQKESVRFKIAQSYMNLYESSHSTRKRITHKQIRIAYDHIKDFRNICAHDERLYSARVSPNRDVSFAKLIDELEIVLPEVQYNSLRMDILQELVDCFQEIGSLEPLVLVNKMGYKSVDEIVL